MRNRDYYLLSILMIVIILFSLYLASIVSSNRLEQLQDENERLCIMIKEKDREYQLLQDSMLVLKEKRDSIIYSIDTIIKYRNEEISNLDNVDADSILRIITNYLPD